MAFNGAGVFVRLYNWVNDAAANIKIRADRMDNEMNGFATGLSTCITKDGQTTITANLPMAGFRHTGVGNASNRTDYAATGQVQDGKLAWVDGGGTADAITASYAIPITALVDGQLCYVRATAANATTTPTFSPSALTARTIVKNGGSALVAGDIAGDGHELILRYDLANTRWELMNPKVLLSTIPFTAASASGAASLGFAEDTDNGTSVATLQGAAALAGDITITLPAVTSTLATLDGTETLTNKTLTAPVISTISNTGTVTLPTATDTLVARATTDTLTNKTIVAANNTITIGTLDTPAASTSGSSVNFTGIPSTATKVTINLVGVSTNGTNPLFVQIGDAGGLETTGYSSTGVRFANSVAPTVTASGGTGYRVEAASASLVMSGSITLTKENASNNTWCAQGVISDTGLTVAMMVSGSKSLSATLDRISLVTADTFDAGEVNVWYE